MFCVFLVIKIDGFLCNFDAICPDRTGRLISFRNRNQDQLKVTRRRHRCHDNKITSGKEQNQFPKSASNKTVPYPPELGAVIAAAFFSFCALPDLHISSVTTDHKHMGWI